MPTLSEILSNLPTYGADDPDDPQGSYLQPVKRAIETTASHFDRGYANRAQQAIKDYQAVQDFADDPRNRYPNPYMASYEQRAAQQAYDEYMDPNALQKYAEKHPEFAQAYGELQDYRRKGYDVEDQHNFEIEKAPMVQRVINQQEANRYTPYEQGRGADAEYYASLPPGHEADKYDTGSFSKIPDDFRRFQRQWVGEDNLKEAQLNAQDARKRDGREEVAWGQMQQNRLNAANETLPGEVGRDGPTEALWKAKDKLQNQQVQKDQQSQGSTVKTGNGEFSTASTAPSRDSDRWGVKFDPNETAKFLFGDGILSQPMAIPDASSRGKTQVTPQMAQQVQALEQVYSTRDPRLIPGNPQFDMFAFADYLLGLRAKNQALYQQRMGGAMQGGYAGAQAPQISPETMAEYQGQLSEAKQLGLQGGIDRYGNRVFYDPRTKRIFKSIAEYKQSISTSNPSVAPSAGER